MSDTVLGHPLVRRYLADLDMATMSLPAQQAAELQAQIAGHLDEALAPGACDEDVAWVLEQLGKPGDLAAEARGASAGPPKPRVWQPWWSRLRWRHVPWIAAAAAVLVLTGYGAVIRFSPGLQQGEDSLWWYPQDLHRQVYTSADDAQQVTVPIRSGQLQGVAIAITNPSNWTQTILGSSVPFAFGGQPQISVSTVDSPGGDGFPTRQRYQAPGFIPPHATRWVKVIWRSSDCLAPGTEQVTDTLQLRVRVGWLTRTENIPLDQGWSLKGPSAPGNRQGHCV